MPEIGALYRVPQPPEYHAEGNVGVHTRLTVEALPPDAPAEVLWAGLLHDVGKAATTRMEGGKLVAHGHDRAGAALAEGILGRLDVAEETRAVVAWLVRHHLFHFSWNLEGSAELSPRQRRRVRDPRFPLLLELLRADSLASHGGGGGLKAYERYRKVWEDEMSRVSGEDGSCRKR